MGETVKEIPEILQIGQALMPEDMSVASDLYWIIKLAIPNLPSSNPFYEINEFVCDVGSVFPIKFSKYFGGI
jgi:hypothetical protein